MNVIEDRFFPPQGFQAAGIACGLKPNGARDVALLVSDRPASAAGMFTTNRVQAAPIQVNREHLQSGTARAIVVNSKNANACTGEQGVADARTMARIAADGPAPPFDAARPPFLWSSSDTWDSSDSDCDGHSSKRSTGAG